MKYLKPAKEDPPKMFAFINHRILIKLLWLTGIIMGLAISACDTRAVDSAAKTNSRKENDMESIQTATTTQYKIPPIDTAAPENTETATFALG
jgi:hypothetical protein